MKRYITFTLLLIIFIIPKVNAIELINERYISAYYSFLDGEEDYRGQFQYILDNEGNIVYRLNPKTKPDQTNSFSIISDNETIPNLTSEQKNQIKLIAYFGYGYNENRLTSKWYYATQVLIFRAIYGEDKINFVTSATGNIYHPCEEEMTTIQKEVNNFKTDFKYTNISFDVSYNDKYINNTINNEYKVLNSNYDYILEESLTINNIKSSGNITLYKDSNYYKDLSVFVHESTDNYYLRNGNIKTEEYSININVINGLLKINLNTKDEYYSIEKTLDNTCINISGPTKNTLCFNDLEKEKSILIPLGTYNITINTIGLGYKYNKEHSININENHLEEELTINLEEIVNTILINKIYCDEELCIEEKNSKYNIYNINKELIRTITTDENGNASIRLGYGTYFIKEILNETNSPLIEEYSEIIKDDITSHAKKLTSFKDKEESIIENTEYPDNNFNENHLFIPNTGIKEELSSFTIISLISCIISFIVIRTIKK